MSTDGDSVDFRALFKRSLLKISELKAELGELGRARTEPIAVTGLGCRFPGGGSHPEAFWGALRGGVDAIREIPPERWPEDALPPGHPGTRWAGVLDAVDGLDAPFFGISPREAVSLDPQQRLLLEVAWEALEHAGEVPNRLVGSRTGVFVGVANQDHFHRLASRSFDALDAYCITGSMLSVAAGRLSYVFGFQGPCLSVDTACSSSLVAIHLACQSLRNGESDLALAGGVNLILSPMTMYLLAQTQALSPDGRCKVFDARANGFVRAEGCGVVVLKRLADAQRDGDRIWALVRGSAMNQDGRSTGLTAPNVLSQQALLRQALESAQVSPSQVGYIEAHGTGTSLGDPIEVEALKEVLGAPRRDGSPCWLGSVKANLGHLETAAGVAGVIKVVLSMHHGVIPRQRHFRALNPRISLEDTPFVIPLQDTPWPRGEAARIAGVSSFGMSGTNAHVVLEEAPRAPAPEAAESIEESAPRLLPLSARSREALIALADAYRRHLTDDRSEAAADIGYTAGVRRSHHEHRLAVVGQTRGEWAEALSSFARGEARAGVTQGEAAPGTRATTVFVFSGQGAQWVGMGRELLHHEPVFRANIEACDALAHQHAGFSLVEELSAGEERSRLHETAVAQPAIFAVQAGIAALLRSWGVVPDAVIGHSVGEVAAAHVAGILSLEEAMRLVALRGRVMQRATGLGKMAHVAIGAEEAEAALRGARGRVGIAAVNAPRSVVLSGEEKALTEVLEQLGRARVSSRMLRVNYAFHSPQMEPLGDELFRALGRVEARRGEIAMISTVTGALVDGEALSAAYWARNLREPVQLARAVEASLSAGHRIFVEVGPHPVVSADLDQCASARAETCRVAGTLRRGQGERRALIQAVGALYAHGAAVDWKQLYPKGRLAPLPTYPWQRQRYWMVSSGHIGHAQVAASASRYALSGQALNVPGETLHQVLRVGVSHQPYLADHIVHGHIVVPGAFHLAVVLSVAADRFGATGATLRDVQFLRPLVLSRDLDLHLSLRARPGGGYEFTLSTAEEGGDRDAPGFLDHVQGTLLLRVERRTGAPPLSALRERLVEGPPLQDLFRRMEALHVTWGPRWRWMEEVRSARDATLSRIAPSAGSRGDGPLHPILLDNGFATGLLRVIASQDHDVDGAPRLPWTVKELRWLGAPAGSVLCLGRVRPGASTDETVSSDLVLFDEGGQVFCEIDEFVGKRAPRTAFLRLGATEMEAPLFALQWEARAAGAASSARPGGGRWLLVSDTPSRGAALRDAWDENGVTWAHWVFSDSAAPAPERVVRVDARRSEGLTELFAEARSRGPLDGVVCWWGGDGEEGELAASRAESNALAALHLVQAIVRSSRGGQATPPRLVWVTEGAQAVHPADASAVSQSPLWGLGRVVMQEHPELRCSLVDLPPATDGADLLEELHTGGDEAQVAWRDGARYAARLVKAGAAPASAAPLPIPTESTVLITGGLGALGLHVAKWLVEDRRVRHLILVGRRAPDGARLAAVEALRAAGAMVTVAQVDVADPAAVQALLAAVPPELPLSGVVHAAGVLDDGVLAQQTGERFSTVFAPKVQGAWNLHVQTRHLRLAFFVMFSSAASLLGPAGQGNYAAANAFLDALAARRRAEGLPAHSLSFGPWSEGGMAERLTAAQRARYSALGIGALSPGQAIALLEQVLLRKEAWLAVLPMNLRTLQHALSAGEVPSIWRALVGARPAAPRAAAGAWRGRLAALPKAARATEVEAHVQAEVAKVLAMSSAADVPIGRPLQELGLDSLMAVELRNALAARAGAPLPATLIFDHPTVSALSRYLLDNVLVEDVLVVEDDEEPMSAGALSRGGAFSDEPIAITGVGCRFPGGVRDPESYWKLLIGGVDAIREVPKERWDIDAYYDPDPDVAGKVMTRFGGFLDEIDRFDPGFFGISPREAVKMDPQQRLLLETSWEALERAGQTVEQLMDSDTGVYMGICANEYQLMVMEDAGAVDGYALLGTVHSTSVGRLSYWLGLKGPSVPVDTACSSSLVAVHLACQALRTGECSQALAGGVSVILRPEGTMCFSRLRAMSPSGRCRTFSADADGYVRSEGCGVVVLKRLSDAERDGDPIQAVIRGTAVNQDGRSNGLTAPNGPAQQAVIRRALQQGGVAPAEVGYVETHGTGTPLGDPIEVQALGAVLGQGRTAERPVVIGSVKTNIGHTEGAAGVAGLIKAVLCVQRGEIPPSLHFAAPNPHVAWSDLPVKVAAAAMPWPAGAATRIAAVSAFGISGTNAHVVLEQPPRAAEAARPEAAPREAMSPAVLLLSGRSREALSAQAEAYRAFLRETTDRSEDIAYTASVRRSHHEHRLAVVGASREEWAESLDAIARGEAPKGVAQGQAVVGTRPKVVFVFPGQGSQWPGMGRELFDREPVFRAAIEACDRVIRREGGDALIDELHAGADRTSLHRLDVVQPALFAMQVAIAALWRAWGVEPDAVVGHSMGEAAAAYVAGALSLEDAAAVICRRSKLALRVAGKGAMAVVELSMEEAERAIAGVEDRLSVAASNSPRSTVLSGDPAAMDEVLARLTRDQVFCRRVNVDFASHSPHVDPLLEDLREQLAGISPRAASVPMVSTVTGDVSLGAELAADYWARNLRAPVLFSQAIAQLVKSGHSLFVEVSPHPILVPAVQEGLPEGDARVGALGSLRREQPERRSLLESLSVVHSRGYPVAWREVHPAGRCVALPAYRWQKERYWIEDDGGPRRASTQARDSGSGASGHPLIGAPFTVVTQPKARFWERAIGGAASPYLSEHRVQGDAVLPGAAYVEMALSAGRVELGAGPLVLEQVRFDRMLVLPGDAERTVQLVLTEAAPGQASFQIFAREGEGWVLHAAGRVGRADGAPEPGSAPEALRQRCPEVTSSADHYRRMEDNGLSYGAPFQGIAQIFRGAGEVLARACIPQDEAARASDHELHPILLDSGFQAMAELVTGREAEGTYVPVGLERLVLWRRPGREIWIHGRRRAEASGAAAITCDLRLIDGAGEVVAEAVGLRAERLSSAAKSAQDPREAWLYAVAWRRKEPLPEPPTPTTRDGAWLVLADRGETGAALASLLAQRGEACIRVVPGERRAHIDQRLYQVDPADPAGYRALFQELFGEGRPCLGVVHLFSLDARTPAETTERTLTEDQRLGSLSALFLAQALLQHGFRDIPPLWLVTRGVHAVDAERAAISVAQAPLWGLGRVLSMEHPELRCTRVDLSPARAEHEATALLRELSAKDREDQVALRGDGRYVARLTRTTLTVERGPRGALSPAAGRPYRLETRAPGALERLGFVEAPRRAPGPGEVEIEVVAAGLNFIDVMKAMGIYPGLPPGPIVLGGECAGRVVAVGEGVRNLEVGDEVIAVASGSFGSHVTTPALFAAKKPAQLGFEQAAAIPVVFMTVVYALSHLGRLGRGERVLIHAASGGTGLAAIQYARSVGAEIFATAGSDEKRDYLRSLGVEHVMDSRSLAFADEVMRRTNGRGVDVVLNSLSGEAIQKSLEVLAPYGRFLEIGKRDIYQNSRLGLLPFRNSLHYVAIDLAGMGIERPELFASLLHEVVARFEAGTFEPLPTQAFPASEVEGAFRRMAQAKHIGKLVIAMGDPEVRIAGAASSNPSSLRPDGTYLITGGLGGLGLSVARWMVAQGARHLALLGRGGASSEAAQAGVAALQQAGADVLVLEADVAREADVRAALASVEARLPPLRGVIHAAGVLDDRTALELDAPRFVRVTAPKVQGAWNLHASTLDQPLDFFVLYSSAASLIGSPGQGNYAAGNAFLDALAHHRRALGLPALSINWGAFSEVGLAAARENRGERLAYRGVASLSPDEGTDLLGRLLDHERCQMGVLKLDLRQWLEFYPGAARSPLWAELRSERDRGAAGNAKAASVVDALVRAAPGDRPALLEQLLRAQLGRVLRLDPGRIDRTTPFTNLGVDSLMGLELRNRLESDLGLRLSATLLFSHPTLAALSAHLLEKLVSPDERRAAQAPFNGDEPPAAAAAREAISSFMPVDLAKDNLNQLSDEALASLTEALLK